MKDILKWKKEMEKADDVKHKAFKKYTSAILEEAEKCIKQLVKDGEGCDEYKTILGKLYDATHNYNTYFSIS